MQLKGLNLLAVYLFVKAYYSTLEYQMRYIVLLISKFSYKELLTSVSTLIS